MENRRKIGDKYEEIAVSYLEKQGYEIRERNFRCRQGEIDIVAKQGETLVFVEVKYRKDSAFGMPQEAVDYKKQAKIRSVSLFYMAKNGISEEQPVRYDVVSILGSQIRVIKNAF